MKKKVVALLLTGAMVGTMFAGCGSDSGKESSKGTEKQEETKGDDAAETEKEEKKDPVELNVVTTFAGEDANALNYQEGIKAWQEETGNTVNDNSASADETFKTTVVADFEMDAEPDVLFFFSGADANSFIEAGKVMSLEDIRKEYPDYASNMDDTKIPASLVDGKTYVVPTNGYWEAMYVNTKVLEDCGVSMPTADYTWDQFMKDCETIKAKGYAPVAAALGNIPHYWWEYSIFNNETDLAKHDQIPASVDEADSWVKGMEDVKAMYEAGCFPENTLSATDDETFQLFVQDKAAFLLDGSWKVGGITGACQSDPDDPSTLDEEALDKYDVTYVPAKGARKANELIGGFSMGYYITKKAWDDPEKRDAAVNFVEYMTTDDMIMKFAQHAASPLKEVPEMDESTLNGLQIKAINFGYTITGYTPAAQDNFLGQCRVPTFDGMPDIVTGKVDAKDAVQEGFELYAEAAE